MPHDGSEGTQGRDARAGGGRRVGDVYPSLTYADPAGAIDWLCRAFGFSKRFVVPGPGGRIEHSELSFGEAVIMVSSPKPDMKRVPPGEGLSLVLSLYVADPDAHCARAIQAGAVIVRALRTEEYGARGYMAQDPEGHQWYFGDYRPGGYWTS